jgi:hypothetical protein
MMLFSYSGVDSNCAIQIAPFEASCSAIGSKMFMLILIILTSALSFQTMHHLTSPVDAPVDALVDAIALFQIISKMIRIKALCTHWCSHGEPEYGNLHHKEPRQIPNKLDMRRTSYHTTNTSTN